MNENINLCEILKDCPVGVEFWSPLADVVKFGGIYNNQINVTLSDNTEWYIEPNGKMEMVELTAKSFISAEIMLYPSKDQRDWSKWECPQKSKKPKFDPKTLKPFDKVVVQGNYYTWKCGLFSHIDELDDAVKQIKKFKPKKFVHDNSKMLNLVSELIDK